ncbi:hypothetical protein F511_30301 [Dorcoceras hygrometricum]|uniref:Auxin-responsive protein n=1 Tax=Dorcoceras hygrometricum TaxID=472368 RepID=A0A2Z7CFF2_9LAMI|nr:hypothetical protein F511_30301 [Dorcoceras hygrometricum]
MSPPLLGIEGKSQCNVSLMASSTSTDFISHNELGFKERNYMGLADCSSMNSSAFSSIPEENKNKLNLKATELRLGLPGCQSPERDSGFTLLSSGNLDEKQLFPLAPSKEGICSVTQKTVTSGNKRGFSDTVEGINEGNWMLNGPVSDPEQKTNGSIKTETAAKKSQECINKMNGSNANSIPAAKAQVVGWPPIRSYRKNTLASNTKNNDEVDGKPGPGALFVKVSMDGAPYLRKVDLRMYSAYAELSTGLEKMFSCFPLGKCGPQGAPNKERLSENKMSDLLHGTDYVLTYEDKDGDWMLVGDVPWK